MSSGEKIDFFKFCADDFLRPYLRRPFSCGNYSYATNGHIMVRVPRRDDFADLDETASDAAKSAKWDAPLGGHEASTFIKLDVELPAQVTSGDQCSGCEGSGHTHDCPDCQCICRKCGGTGQRNPERDISTTINAGLYALYYVRLMLSLPGLEVQADAKDRAPMLFRFNGGIGALMPLLGKHAQHIDIQKASA